MENWDWKWLIGSVIIPFGTFIAGLFVGKTVERN